MKIIGQVYFEHRQKTLNKILKNRIQLCVYQGQKWDLGSSRMGVENQLNIMHHINKLNEEIYMINLINTIKAFYKTRYYS